MIIDIHPEAINNFNYKAEQLLLTVETKTERKSESKSKSDIFIDQTLDPAKIIGDIIGHTIDASGTELDVYLKENSNLIGLYENNFRNFIKLSESIHRLSEIRYIISFKTIKEILFDWIIKKFKRQLNVDFIDFLLKECQQKIQDNEIYVPIYGLRIESDFNLGHVRFLKISKELIDKWELNLLDKGIDENPNDIENKKAFILKIRRETQGYSVASSKLRAEQYRACEIAIENTENALSILRFFSPANLFPQKVSCCTILGKENLESIKYYIIEDGNLAHMGFESIGNIEKDWKINDEMLNVINILGLNELNQLLLFENLNDYQKKLLDSIIIYSKSSLMKHINEKLIYILVSIESLLLRNSSENIVQNIGERIAFLIADNAKSRKKVIDTVKKAYDLRSNFIHHGLSIDNTDIMNSFMEYIHSFYIQLIKNINYFKDLNHLLDFIEEKKLS